MYRTTTIAKQNIYRFALAVLRYLLHASSTVRFPWVVEVMWSEWLSRYSLYTFVICLIILLPLFLRFTLPNCCLCICICIPLPLHSCCNDVKNSQCEWHRYTHLHLNDRYTVASWTNDGSILKWTNMYIALYVNGLYNAR